MLAAARPSRPAIGSYQAIKHKLADCYVKLELGALHAYTAP